MTHIIGQIMQTKAGVAQFDVLVAQKFEGVQIATSTDPEIFLALDGAGKILGPVIGNTVTVTTDGKAKDVKLTALVGGIDPQALVGKDFADMTPEEQIVYVRYLESLSAAKLGVKAEVAVEQQEAPVEETKKAAKATKVTKAAPVEEPTDEEDDEEEEEDGEEYTRESLKGKDIKQLRKIAKDLELEGVNSRTPKNDLIEAILEAQDDEEDDEEEEDENPAPKSKVLKTDEEVEEDDEEEDEEDSDDDNEGDDGEDTDEDAEDAEDDEDDEEDEDEDGLEALRKKWSEKKIIAIKDNKELDNLRKLCGIRYPSGTALKPSKVKDDIIELLHGDDEEDEEE